MMNKDGRIKMNKKTQLQQYLFLLYMFFFLLSTGLSVSPTFSNSKYDWQKTNDKGTAPETCCCRQKCSRISIRKQIQPFIQLKYILVARFVFMKTHTDTYARECVLEDRLFSNHSYVIRNIYSNSKLSGKINIHYRIQTICNFKIERNSNENHVIWLCSVFWKITASTMVGTTIAVTM